MALLFFSSRSALTNRLHWSLEPVCKGYCDCLSLSPIDQHNLNHPQCHQRQIHSVPQLQVKLLFPKGRPQGEFVNLRSSFCVVSGAHWGVSQIITQTPGIRAHTQVWTSHSGAGEPWRGHWVTGFNGCLPGHSAVGGHTEEDFKWKQSSSLLLFSTLDWIKHVWHWQLFSLTCFAVMWWPFLCLLYVSFFLTCWEFA